MAVFTQFRRWTTRGRPTTVGLTDSKDAATPGDVAGEPESRTWRRAAGGIVTALAFVLVLLALVAPDDLRRFSVGAFVRVPVEGLVGVALALVLPATARRIVLAIGGAILGVLTVLKILDMGFLGILDRPFDPLADWAFVTAGVDYLSRSIGRLGAAGAALAAVVATVAVLTLVTLAAIRLGGFVSRHRKPAIRTTVALAVVWAVCVAFGVQFAPGFPLASSGAAALAYDSARQVRNDLRDQKTFAADAANDAFRNTPSSLLLNGLRGKDVVITFVESYGTVALTDPVIAPGVKAVLAAGNDKLRAAGFSARSAFLTSSTYAGGSWLAHSTLESGMWINNQQLYGDFSKSDRLTLNGAFGRAGWRTVDVEPANTKDLPDAIRAGYDKVYDDRNLGYRGERFNFNSMPDQYTLGAFQRAERAPGHAPVMAEIALLSSHSPWTPTPQLTDWNNIGVGNSFTREPAAPGEPSDPMKRDFTQVRADFGRSIEYSLNTLISYLQAYGDNNLVMVFLGDHQPAASVTGQTAERNVPITIVAHDPAVLDKISSWGWQDGLMPSPQSPVWRMDAFRDRFLTAFGSKPFAH